MKLEKQASGHVFLEGRTQWIDDRLKFALYLLSPLVLLLGPVSLPVLGLKAVGVLAALRMDWVLGRRTLLLTPEEVVIQRGWRRQRLARSRIRYVNVQRQENRFRVELALRDEQGVPQPPGTELEAFDLRSVDAPGPPSEVTTRLVQELRAMDLRVGPIEPPPLEPEPHLEPQPPPRTQTRSITSRQDPLLAEPWSMELSGLDPKLSAIALNLKPPPLGTRFFRDEPPTSPRRFLELLPSLSWALLGVASTAWGLLPLVYAGLGWLGRDGLLILPKFLFGLAMLFVASVSVTRLRRRLQPLRELPGAGLYLMSDTLLHVTWGKAPWVVSRSGVRLVEPSRDASGQVSTRLLYLNDRGAMQERHFHGDEARALQAWFEGKTAQER